MLDLGNVHPVGILQAKIVEILRCVIGHDQPRPTPKLSSSYCGMSGIPTRRPTLFRSNKPGKLFAFSKTEGCGAQYSDRGKRRRSMKFRLMGTH